MAENSIALPALRILSIDADRAFHALVQAAAKSLPGAQVLCCAAPGEALNRMDKFIPALIIIDGRIGGAAGINFVRRVRAGQTTAPAGALVMFAAQDFAGGLSGKLVDVGCHAIVRKPLSPDALARAIVRVFESPVPFVMGGQYLGPERRKPDATAKRDPERRRTPTRGGYAATPRLSRDAMPLVSLAGPVGAKPAAKASGGIETAPIAAKPGGGKIEGLETPEPKQKARAVLVDDTPLPAAKAKQSLVDDTPPPAAKPKRVEQALVDEPPKKKTRDEEPMELAAAPDAKEPDQNSGTEPEFDVGAVVEQHQLWISSSGAQGAKANLEGMSLSGVSLSGQNLAKANMRGTDLSNADLSNCVLIDADMRNAILSQTLLNQAQMAGAKIRHADLQFAQLTDTGLQGSDLAGADLRGAVLTGADLSGANLLGVDLRGADVTGINLSQRQLDRARGDHTTKLPPGLFVRMGEAIE